LTSIVVDASVAVKWCLPVANESLVSQAQQMLDAHSRGELHFLVPDLFWAELGNVLWKAVRIGRTSRSKAMSGLASIRDLNIPTSASVDLLQLGLRIAFAHDRTVYDSLYVALAVQSGSVVITADEKLANALAAHLPVKWLGSFY
jgi:predicted nucleic acid-binding protein